MTQDRLSPIFIRVTSPWSPRQHPTERISRRRLLRNPFRTAGKRNRNRCPVESRPSPRLGRRGESRVELYDFTDIRAARCNTVHHSAHLRRELSAKVVLLSVDVFSSDHVPGRLRWRAAPVETRVKSAIERGGPRTQGSLSPRHSKKRSLSLPRVLGLEPRSRPQPTQKCWDCKACGHFSCRYHQVGECTRLLLAGGMLNITAMYSRIISATGRPRWRRGGEERQEADDGGGSDGERVGKGIQKEEGTGPCDSDHPPCDFKYVHRFHASAVPQDVPFGFLTSRESSKPESRRACNLTISFKNSNQRIII